MFGLKLQVSKSAFRAIQRGKVDGIALPISGSASIGRLPLPCAVLLITGSARNPHRLIAEISNIYKYSTENRSNSHGRALVWLGVSCVTVIPDPMRFVGFKSIS
jgi:hypothetical protein